MALADRIFRCGPPGPKEPGYLGQALRATDLAQRAWLF